MGNKLKPCPGAYSKSPWKYRKHYTQKCLEWRPMNKAKRTMRRRTGGGRAKPRVGDIWMINDWWGDVLILITEIVGMSVVATILDSKNPLRITVNIVCYEKRLIRRIEEAQDGK